MRLTSSAICGTDLHMIRGTLSGMKEGTILGHEGVGTVEEVGPQVRNLNPGGAPSQSAQWATQAVCKAGTIGVIGVFSPQAMSFPIGALQQRNLTVRGGNCNHRRYIPKLVGLVATGALDPTDVLTHREPAIGAIEAYEAFDQRQPGWIKVELLPEAG